MGIRYSSSALLLSLGLVFSTPRFCSAAIITLSNNTFSTSSTEGWIPYSNSAEITSATADANFSMTSPVLAVTNPLSGGGINARSAIKFDAVTLINTGDYIQADFDVRVVGLTNSVSRLFQTALYNNDGTTQPGYVGSLRMSDPSSYATGYVNALNANSDVSVTGGKQGGTPLIAIPPTTSLGISATKVRHFIMTITKTDTGIDLLYSGGNDTTGVVALTASDTNPFLTFNTLDLNTFGNNVAFNLDNVLITTNVPVPEPSSIVLGVVSVCGLLIFRRRARRIF